jgi:hypothetical protein
VGGGGGGGLLRYFKVFKVKQLLGSCRWKQEGKGGLGGSIPKANKKYLKSLGCVIRGNTGKGKLLTNWFIL